MTKTCRIVIIGGGFAGLEAARALDRAPVEITLLDRQNHHCFQPLLYQVATATSTPADVARPMRGVLSGQQNVRVLMANVEGIDPERRLARTGGGTLPYDQLIIATGATHAYLGHGEWAPHAPGLKRIEDATETRRRILLAFECAELEDDAERRAALTALVVVGGEPATLLGPAATRKRSDRHLLSPTGIKIVMSEYPVSDDVRLQPPGPPEMEIEIAARTLVIGPYPTHNASASASGAAQARNLRSTAARLDEAAGLAAAVDLNVVQFIPLNLPRIRPATYLGKGRVDELAGLIKAEEVGLVVMDCALLPVQQRNLEKAWGVKVIDRTGLILEIFGRRASTREGTLQVEHAHLAYKRSRLVRSWTHLERQRGGFGFLGGPGETQIEAEDVGQVLDELGIRSHADRIIEVWNKADRLDGAERTRLLNLSVKDGESGRHDRDSAAPVPVSAVTGEGLAALTSRIEARLARSRSAFAVVLPPEDGAQRHWLYENAEVLDRREEVNGTVHLAIRIAPEEPRLLHRFPEARTLRRTG